MRFCESLESAKQKYCPYTFNRQPRTCVADRCMAWRWVRTYIESPANPLGEFVESDDTHGYCGLAGPAAEQGPLIPSVL